MAVTLQERYAEALFALHFIEQKPTSNYRVFRGHYPNDPQPIYVYLGRAGGVRYNRHGKISKGSISLDPKSRTFSLLFNFTNVDFLELDI